MSKFQTLLLVAFLFVLLAMAAGVGYQAGYKRGIGSMIGLVCTTGTIEPCFSSTGPNSPNIIDNTGQITIKGAAPSGHDLQMTACPQDATCESSYVPTSPVCHVDLYTCWEGQAYRNHVFNSQGFHKEATEDCFPVPARARQDPLTKNWFNEAIPTPSWGSCPQGYSGPML